MYLNPKHYCFWLENQNKAGDITAAAAAAAEQQPHARIKFFVEINKLMNIGIPTNQPTSTETKRKNHHHHHHR